MPRHRPTASPGRASGFRYRGETRDTQPLSCHIFVAAAAARRTAHLARTRPAIGMRSRAAPRPAPNNSAPITQWLPRTAAATAGTQWQTSGGTRRHSTGCWLLIERIAMRGGLSPKTLWSHDRRRGRTIPQQRGSQGVARCARPQNVLAQAGGGANGQVGHRPVRARSAWPLPRRTTRYTRWQCGRTIGRAKAVSGKRQRCSKGAA